MDRFLAGCSTLLAVLALGLMINPWRAPLAQPALENAPLEIDLAAAKYDLQALREQRGSILAGSALATNGDQAQEFKAALASYVGEADSEESQHPLDEPPISKTMNFVIQLRDTAQALDQQAAEWEMLERYAAADELRELATQLRARARQFHLE